MASQAPAEPPQGVRVVPVRVVDLDPVYGSRIGCVVISTTIREVGDRSTTTPLGLLAVAVLRRCERQQHKYSSLARF